MFDHGLDPAATESLVHGRHHDPFAVLGPHPSGSGQVVRSFQPAAERVELVDRHAGQVLAELTRVHPAGLFAAPMPADVPYMLRIHDGSFVRETEDPYSFGPVLGDLDLHLLAEGRHHELGQCLGAHMTEHEGVRGVRFAVWAPNARRVSVVGTFNAWDGRCHPMRLRHVCGVWEIFIPRVLPGTLYKYELIGPAGDLLPQKADPVAAATEEPPATASVVATPSCMTWSDGAWIAGRAARQSAPAPMSIYEVHALSWIRAHEPGRCGWDVLTDRLVPYAAGMGFTHLELLPIMEHPFAGSWGYQPLGQFAPTARLGPPEAFARFVDGCHQAGLGVILDWVPAHFPNDAHGLIRFDGTPLYEHADPREGFHPDWNTMVYNLGRNEVRGFLIGSALHWLERYHVDGLRVDAVASMLYRDYSRRAGEWLPNRYGGRENLEAIDFLRELSRTVAGRCPGALLIAEESTAWPGVTHAPASGGLGFDFKWNMGWMHDTLRYMKEDPVHRRYHHDDMTFGLVYAFSERFVLPLSHDEVVYGKRSLLGRMPGDRWQRFANLRAYLGFMWSHPGKKLLFMGGEFAQEAEWNHDSSLEWDRLDDPAHRGVQHLVRDLNHLYAATPSLHRRDAEPAGFRWVVLDDRAQSVLAWLRFGEAADPPILAVCNFTPVPRHGYQVGVPQAGPWHEVLNTDAAAYGGAGIGNGGRVVAHETPSHGLPAALDLTVPPLATLILRAG
jgi:1,4-alpha-glucan branching enzyme